MVIECKHKYLRQYLGRKRKKNKETTYKVSWIIMNYMDGGAIFLGRQVLNFDKEMVGKKVRIKIEIIEPLEEEFIREKN